MSPTTRQSVFSSTLSLARMLPVTFPETSTFWVSMDLPLDRSLNHQVLIAGDLPVDDDARTNDRIRHFDCFPSQMSSGSFTSIWMVPLKTAPSSITTRGALMSPVTLAVELIDTRDPASMFPLVSPLIVN